MIDTMKKLFGDVKSKETPIKNDALEAQFHDLSGQIEDNQVQLQQILSLLSHEQRFYPPPPKHLQVRVVGTYVKDFFNSGYTICDDLNGILRNAGKELGSFGNVLDFGCGCGRIIRAFKNRYPDCRLYGSDVDGESIGWLQSNWAGVADFYANPPVPPTTYKDGQFDFIFSISVLTHLPEDMQFQWLEELRRITRPGGYLVLSTHGEGHYGKFSGEPLKAMNEKGFYYAQPGFNYGKSIGLPDYYQNAYHSHAYIRREWSRYFRVLHIETLGISHYQDAVLLQKTP